jgi:hypothetical protein
MKKSILISSLIFFTLCKPKNNELKQTKLPYKIGYDYTFSFDYSSKENNPSYIVFYPPFYDEEDVDYSKNWYFLENKLKRKNKDDAVIKYVKLITHKGFVNEGQTAIEYQYLDGNNNETCIELTGLIQNKDSIWFHPPRTRSFEMLEINPFPQIHFPLQLNKKWISYLEVDDKWADKRIFFWKGTIKIKTDYEIVDKAKFNTKFGLLDCYKIHAKATNKYGSSELTAYYNEKYGFVKLDYLNINKSRLIISLLEVKKTKCP